MGNAYSSGLLKAGPLSDSKQNRVSHFLLSTAHHRPPSPAARRVLGHSLIATMSLLPSRITPRPLALGTSSLPHTASRLCLQQRGDVPWERGKAEWLLSPPFLLSLWPPPVSRKHGRMESVEKHSQ